MRDSTLLLEAAFHVKSMPAWTGPVPSGTRRAYRFSQPVGCDLVSPLVCLWIFGRDLEHLWLLSEKLGQARAVLGVGFSLCAVPYPLSLHPHFSSFVQ